MKKYLFTLLMLFFAVNATACLETESYKDTDIPPHVTVDNTKEEHVVRLVAYNVGIFSKTFKETNERSYQMVADMMEEIEADAVCLNELDSLTERTGGVYQIDYISSLMKGGWDYHFRAAMQYDGGKYGEGIMTREKAVKKDSKVLEKGVGAEPRVLVIMEMDDYVICTTHLDHKVEASRLDHIGKITAYLKEKYGNAGKPVFIGGDMNDTPDSPTGKAFQQDWDILSITGYGTYSSKNPVSCIDYILQLKGTPKCEVVGSQVLRWFKNGDVTIASDHLPVMLDVKIPAQNQQNP